MKNTIGLTPILKQQILIQYDFKRCTLKRAQSDFVVGFHENGYYIFRQRVDFILKLDFEKSYLKICNLEFFFKSKPTKMSNKCIGSSDFVTIIMIARTDENEAFELVHSNRRERSICFSAFLTTDYW